MLLNSERLITSGYSQLESSKGDEPGLPWQDDCESAIFVTDLIKLNLSLIKFSLGNMVNKKKGNKTR